MHRDSLTDKQREFIRIYLETENSSEAYRRAYRSKGDARYTSREGLRLLATPKIAAIIATARERGRTGASRAVAQAIEKYEHTRERVLLELHRIAYVNAASIAGKMPEELTEAEGRAIKAIEVTEITQKDGTKARKIRYTLYDKRGALELIGKALPDGSMWDEPAPPPPPPPVPADQQPSTAATPDQRAVARMRVLRMLDSLAVPAPLDIEVTPPKPNGKGPH